MTDMTERRFDVVYAQHGVELEDHFCREYGCFGTNPDHGFTFDEAKNEVANHYANLATYWRDMTFEYWRKNINFETSLDKTGESDA